MNNISPLASVSPKAILGDNVEIGPFAFVDDDVEIGDGCKIFPHATVFQYVKMGKNCQMYPGAVVGAVPQDLKFEGEVTSVELGDNVTVRECATINRGTKASGKYVTKVGSDTLIMSYSHVAHDCVIGDHCILVSYVGLAGETVVDDWAIIGGGSKAHQFSKVGCHAMVGGMCKIRQDFPPYMLGDMVEGSLKVIGPNVVGLTRRGFSREVIHALKEAHRFIYRDGLNRTQALDRVENDVEQFDEIKRLVAFYRNSQRGVA